MSWTIFLIISIVLLLSLLLSGVRVFIGFLVLNIVGVLMLMGVRGAGLFTNSLYETATSPTLLTVALFVLMGEILFRSGTVNVLFNSIDRLIGHIRGRLYIVVISMSTVFGALSGSAVAVAAMLGRSLLPMMVERGYDRKLSASTILSGASLAPIIPPSLLAVVVGSLADVSISGLLIAGVIPGLIFATVTLIYVLYRMKDKPVEAGDVDSSIESTDIVTQHTKTKLSALLEMTPFLIVIFSVMGLIMLGVATPSESAATGVIGALLVAAWFRKLNLRMMGEALGSAVSISAVILIIVCSAKLFSQLLSFAGATRGLVEFAGAMDLGPDMMFLLMMAIPFFLCMFIDQLAFMLLAIPLYQPLVKAFEFDPIWFWTIFLINLTVASLTPPFGYTLFALKGACPSLTTNEVFRAAWPVVIIFVFGMALLWAVPGLVTFLPGLFI